MGCCLAVQEEDEQQTLYNDPLLEKYLKQAQDAREHAIQAQAISKINIIYKPTHIIQEEESSANTFSNVTSLQSAGMVHRKYTEINTRSKPPCILP